MILVVVVSKYGSKMKRIFFSSKKMKNLTKINFFPTKLWFWKQIYSGFIGNFALISYTSAAPPIPPKLSTLILQWSHKAVRVTSFCCHRYKSVVWVSKSGALVRLEEAGQGSSKPVFPWDYFWKWSTTQVQGKWVSASDVKWLQGSFTKIVPHILSFDLNFLWMDCHGEVFVSDQCGITRSPCAGCGGSGVGVVAHIVNVTTESHPGPNCISSRSPQEAHIIVATLFVWLYPWRTWALL